MDGNPVAKNASRLLETNKHSRRLPLRLSICRRRLQTQTLAPTEAWEEEGETEDWSRASILRPLPLILSLSVCLMLFAVISRGVNGISITGSARSRAAGSCIHTDSAAAPFACLPVTMHERKRAILASEGASRRLISSKESREEGLHHANRLFAVCCCCCRRQHQRRRLLLLQ